MKVVGPPSRGADWYEGLNVRRRGQGLSSCHGGAPTASGCGDVIQTQTGFHSKAWVYLSLQPQYHGHRSFFETQPLTASACL